MKMIIKKPDTKEILPKNVSEIFLNGKKKIDSSFFGVFCADAKMISVAEDSIDLIFTSPAYWQKRDYELEKQIGWEKSAQEYAEVIGELVNDWKQIVKKTGSLFLNIGDSYLDGRLLDIPSLIVSIAQKNGWILRHRIVWEKPNTTPHSARKRLALREESILHFTLTDNYYWDLEGYKKAFGSVSNVWRISPAQHKGGHLAPFPEELVERVLTLACPKFVCAKCEKPFVRQIEKTAELDETRPQARRALAIAEEKGLTAKHIAAIQAVGISDAGKALKFQNGAGKNGEATQILAREAKEILGGYFREFTFAKKRTVGWRGCDCGANLKTGLLYDPFVGTGTSLRVAARLGFSAIGSDLRIYDDLLETLRKIDASKKNPLPTP